MRAVSGRYSPKKETPFMTNPRRLRYFAARFLSFRACVSECRYSILLQTRSFVPRLFERGASHFPRRPKVISYPYVKCQRVASARPAWLVGSAREFYDSHISLIWVKDYGVADMQETEPGLNTFRGNG